MMSVKKPQKNLGRESNAVLLNVETVVKRFAKRVIRRASWPRERKLDARPIDPLVEMQRYEFGAVIAMNAIRGPALCNGSL